MKSMAHVVSVAGPLSQVNEDSFVSDEQRGLYVVCDGMGAHAAGEVASSLACQIIWGFVAERLDDPEEVSRGVLERALREACRGVYEYGTKNPEAGGLGTTATAMLFREGLCYVAHVGDSRAYLVRGGVMNQLTRDHTLVAEFVEQGMLPAEGAASSPYAHVLTRALGSQPSVAVDSLRLDVVPGDRFLLCSDGVHPGISCLERALIEGEEDSFPGNFAQHLVDEALRNGSEDDVTAIEVSVEAGVVDAPRDMQVILTFGTLKEMMLFEGLDFAELAHLVEYASIREAHRGEFIIRQGTIGREMYVILEGAVRVERCGSALASLQPGDHFGEMSVLSGRPRSADVIATADATLLEIPEEAFLALADWEPTIGIKLYRALAARLCEYLWDGLELV